jgi:hypothetical protein
MIVNVDRWIVKKITKDIGFVGPHVVECIWVGKRVVEVGHDTSEAFV